MSIWGGGSCGRIDSPRQLDEPKAPRIGTGLPAHHVVLLELVAELAEGHLQQLGRLGLHAAGPVERPLEIAAFDGVERRLQVATHTGQVDRVEPLEAPTAPDRSA